MYPRIKHKRSAVLQYPNFFIQYPLVESRVLWWQVYHQKMDGFLYWNMTHWKSGYTPINPSSGPFYSWQFDPGPYNDWPPGDGMFIYPHSNGSPIGTIRLSNIRDGIEDYEYLWMLGEKIGVENARSACTPVAWGLSGSSPPYTHDSATIRATRDSIAHQTEP